MMMSMKIRPLHDRVVVKRLEERQQTAAGIVIPDTAAQKPVEGEVVAAGSGKRLKDGTLRALDVKVGDKGVFAEHAGDVVKVRGEEFLVIREDDLVGVVEEI